MAGVLVVVPQKKGPKAATMEKTEEYEKKIVNCVKRN